MDRRKNNRVNAKKIAESMFLGSSDGLLLLGSKGLIPGIYKDITYF